MNLINMFLFKKFIEKVIKLNFLIFNTFKCGFSKLIFFIKAIKKILLSDSIINLFIINLFGNLFIIIFQKLIKLRLNLIHNIWLKNIFLF